jgi:DNA-binding response OmpR family regulator
MLSTLLRLSLIEAKTVPTAAHALSLIQTERFDVFLLDAWLPDIDGFELCRRLREFDAEVPILFFSGAARPIDRKKGLDAGATDYVVKPDINLLIGSVTRFVAQARTITTTKIIPFDAKVSFATPFWVEPTAA